MVIGIAVLIDTDVLVAYANAADQSHARAVPVINAILDGTYGRPIISTFIFSEAVTVCLIRTKSLARAREFGTYLRTSQIALTPIDDDTFDRAWDIFSQSGTLSFADATSVALLKQHPGTHLATFDRALATAAAEAGAHVVGQ